MSGQLLASPVVVAEESANINPFTRALAEEEPARPTSAASESSLHSSTSSNEVVVVDLVHEEKKEKEVQVEEEEKEEAEEEVVHDEKKEEEVVHEEKEEEEVVHEEKGEKEVVQVEEEEKEEEEMAEKVVHEEEEEKVQVEEGEKEEVVVVEEVVHEEKKEEKVQVEKEEKEEEEKEEEEKEEVVVEEVVPEEKKEEEEDEEVVVVEVEEVVPEETKEEVEEEEDEAPRQEDGLRVEIPTPMVEEKDLPIPVPEAIIIPELPKASKVAQAAGHAADKFTSRLPGYLAKTSALISRFNRLMSTSTGTDRVLMTTGYSLTALTAQLDRISQYRALAQAGKAPKASAVPLSFFRYLLFARRQESSRLQSLSTKLKAFASLISDVRIFMRLWGLFGIYEWLVSTLRDPPKDMTLRKIAYLQIAANILYQVLENLAYLGQHKVLAIGKKRQNSYWLWSSRFWMAHVVLEFWRLKRDRDLSFKGKEAIGAEVEPQWYDVADVMKSDGKKGVWLRQLWSNIAYAPLTVHWSLEGGALSPLSVGTLGAIAGVIGLHQVWRRTA